MAAVWRWFAGLGNGDVSWSPSDEVLLLVALGMQRLHLNQRGALELPGTRISRVFNRSGVDVKRTVGSVRMKLKRIGDAECVSVRSVNRRRARGWRARDGIGDTALVGGLRTLESIIRFRHVTGRHAQQARPL